MQIRGFEPMPSRAHRNQRESEFRALLIVLGLALVAIALLLASVVAEAQTTRTAAISFTAPTKFTDGTDIPATAILAYRLYQGPKGQTGSNMVREFTGTSVTVNSGLQLGETCWAIVVVYNGETSAPSNEACKTFKSPQTVTITVT